jgi:hypothetical protein
MPQILNRLDERCFLGFPIWEFSFRSLSRQYGHAFLRDIVLRHPLRTLNGLLAYRRHFRQARPEGGDITSLYSGTEIDLKQEIIQTNGGLLVALGFCQKPLGESGAGCPAGRFNHVCHVLARDDLLEIGDASKSLAPACRDCDLRTIGTLALQAGATTYIMTSAADIARHLFIPTLERNRFQNGLFILCPYSIPAMILPLLICGLQALLVGYSTGDCRDYDQFLLADEGAKDERTSMSPAARAYVKRFLQDIAQARPAGGTHYRRFQQEGALYVPVSQS